MQKTSELIPCLNQKIYNEICIPIHWYIKNIDCVTLMNFLCECQAGLFSNVVISNAERPTLPDGRLQRSSYSHLPPSFLNSNSQQLPPLSCVRRRLELLPHVPAIAEDFTSRVDTLFAIASVYSIQCCHQLIGSTGVF